MKMLQIPQNFVPIYIMAGRAFVVAKEVFYHGNGSILTQ